MPNSNRSCNGWCPQTVIYIVIARVGLISSLITTNKHDDMYPLKP